MGDVGTNVRRERAQKLLDGYANGPTAGPQATAQALTRVNGAAAVVLVEGVSDQIALETLAARRGRSLEAERVVILPIGGAHAARRFLTRFAAEGVRLAGLCDVAEEEVFRRALTGAGLTWTEGFHVCVADLEDELIRAVGAAQVEALFAAQRELGSFRTLQNQAVWRGREIGAQLRRFLGSGARRKACYARLLVEAVDLDRVPRPLDAVLGAV
jgi:hypothetical protein